LAICFLSDFSRSGLNQFTFGLEKLRILKTLAKLHSDSYRVFNLWRFPGFSQKFFFFVLDCFFGMGLGSAAGCGFKSP
jgi:hypothetical protein